MPRKVALLRNWPVLWRHSAPWFLVTDLYYNKSVSTTMTTLKLVWQTTRPYYIRRCAKFSRMLLGERQVTDEQALHLGKSLNRTFNQYGGHIEFIRFKEYYGMPRGYSLSIYARFSGKKRTSIYISRQKDDHHYIQTRHNDLFFPLQFFSSKT